jgi:type I restriction enzyme R subunit
MSEQKIEQIFINKLAEQKYEHRPDIIDRVTLEQNFRESSMP